MNLDFKSVISNEDYDDAPIADEEAQLAVGEAEVLETADVISDDTDAIDNYGEQLDETVEDVQELESTQADLEEALGDDDYEGMDQVAVEQLNRRLKRISEKRGFDISATRGVFSKESFTGGASNRRRATEYALEGLKDTLKSMWERIKAAIKKLWEGVKKFWRDHISTLGRLMKALEKVRRQAKDAKGSPSREKDATASSQLQTTFPSKKDVSAELIKHFTVRQGQFLDACLEMGKISVKSLTDITNASTDSEKRAVSYELMSDYYEKYSEVLKPFGNSDDPLIKGQFVEIEVDKSSGEQERSDITWKSATSKAQDSRKLVPTNGNSLAGLIDLNIELIRDTRKYGERFSDIEKAYTKAESKINSMISSMNEQNYNNSGDRETRDNDVKNLRFRMSALRSVNSDIPKLSSRLVGLNVACAKGAVAYTKASLATFKS